MRRLIWIALCLSLFLMVGVVSACGGFFCTNTPIDQSAERIIFTINNDDTITAIVGINYTGPAEEFSWIVPVPSVPEMDVAETDMLDLLERATTPNFVSPPNYCNFLYGLRGGGGGGGEFVIEGNVGPYDFAILQSVSTQEVVNWLRNNGYRVTDEMIPLIDVYVREGMYFVALRLSKDSDVGDIQPIVMTYKSVKPMIPIRLTAVAAIPDMPILTWIFADTQYVPENYAHGKVDFSAFRTTNRSQYVGQLDTFAADITFDMELGIIDINRQQFWDARDAIQRENNGLAFITEYAMPSQSLLDSPQWSGTANSALDELLNTYPYVTRLRAQMSPEQMTVDPTFIPAPNEPNRDSLVDIADYVDPLHYFGCSTREALDDVTTNNLPAGRTRIEALGTTITHPDDWTLSEFTFNGRDVRVFAPEPVTSDTVHLSFLPDADVPPMLILLNVVQREAVVCLGGFSRTTETLLWDVFNVSYNSSMLTADGFRGKVWQAWVDAGEHSDVAFPYVVHYEPFNYDCASHQGFVAYLLADDEAWLKNGDTYWAMLQHAQSERYLTHADLQETLMIGTYQLRSGGIQATSDEWVSPIAIGFPDGMIEQWMEGGRVQITSLDTDLQIDLIPTSRLRDAPEGKLTQDVIETLITGYNLDDSARQSLLEALAPYLDLQINPVWHNTDATLASTMCLPELDPVRFEANATYGYLRFEYDWMVVVRANIGSTIPEDMLITIANSMRDPVVSCDELQRRRDEVAQIID